MDGKSLVCRKLTKLCEHPGCEILLQISLKFLLSACELLLFFFLARTDCCPIPCFSPSLKKMLSSSKDVSMHSVKFCRDLMELSAEQQHGQVTPILHGFHCEYISAVMSACCCARPVHLYALHALQSWFSVSSV